LVLVDQVVQVYNIYDKEVVDKEVVDKEAVDSVIL